MKTPICDFVREYADSHKLRLHMPGHKGQGFLGVEHLDITEIEGADVLYKAQGIIRESEDNACKIFGTAATFYSCEGSSLAIRAMLYLVKCFAWDGGQTPVIAAGRNAHKTFVTAAALLNLDVQWIFPEESQDILSCKISPSYLEDFLSNAKEKPTAVYITSPDYLGNMLDIQGIGEVCRKHDILLLVDNAHGAYLNFLSENKHPIHLGADMCCDSAHKTLPVLTGGAYLHISDKAPEVFRQQAENALSLFASTSPSYLILQSLDYANRYMAEGYRKKLAEFLPEADVLRDCLVSLKYTLVGAEPLKVTIAPKSNGYTGTELAGILQAKGIVCEFADPDYVVLMLSPETDKKILNNIKSAFLDISKKISRTGDRPPSLILPQQKIRPGEAILLPSRELPVSECLGSILASPTVSCPPAIPIVVCGEAINESVIELFEYYGIEKCNVVDSSLHIRK